jgi:DNA-directed RNA polymerase subunit RPC12/RpoP
MKDEINIPIQLADLRKEDIISASDRRARYSLVRDLQAKEFNKAILIRLAKDKEKLEASQSEEMIQVKCEQCGKEFSSGIKAKGTANCPECSQDIKID